MIHDSRSGFVEIFEYKIQEFFHFFSKTIISFSRLKFIKWVIYGDLEKRRNKAFSMMRCKIRAD